MRLHFENKNDLVDYVKANHHGILDQVLEEKHNGRLGLTPAMANVLRFIIKYQASRTYAPSYREIMQGVDLKSTSGVYRIVHQLVDRGFIRLANQQSRSIKILRSA